MSVGAGISNTSGSTSQFGAQNVNATGTSDVTKTFDAASKTALDAALADGTYSKSAAMADSKTASDAAMTTMLQTNLPGITSQTKHAGGYDDTTSQLLTNDLAARTAAVGAQTQLKAVTDYATAGAQAVQAASGAVAATSGQKTNTTGQSNTTSSQSSQTDQTSMGAQAGGGTVICTQLWIDGHMSNAVYDADNKYVRKHFSRHTVNGYRFWAVPFVHLMRRSKVVYAVGKYFGLAWSHHCASHYTSKALPNLTGRLLIAVIAPICYCIGAVIPDVRYYKLWKGSY